jgi:hypothetical protein
MLAGLIAGVAVVPAAPALAAPIDVPAALGPR